MRRVTVQMCCDRCGRVWHEDYDQTKEVEPTSISLTVKSPGNPEYKVEYKEMCQACVSAVAGYVSHIDKDTKKVSPQRKSKAKKEVGAAPTPQVTKPKVPEQTAPTPSPVQASTSGKVSSAAHTPSTPPRTPTKE